jgi:heme exporter protein A
MATKNTVESAIRVEGVQKAFGRTPVLRGVDLVVPWGLVLTLLGANGSGKTTLIKILATLTRADTGRVVIGGMDTTSRGPGARRLLGVVTHDPLLYDDLTGRENMRFFAKMFGLDDVDGRVASVTERMGMTDRLDQKVGALSHGMKKRFSIARALLHDPVVLLMDEPESGLDQSALSLLDAVVSDQGATLRSVLMTTHNLERGLALGQRLAILANGRIAYHQSLEDVGADAIREAYAKHTGASA